jgi:hypothetical protein
MAARIAIQSCKPHGLNKGEVNMTSANEIVENYKAAVGKSDFAAARQMLHDDLNFQGPLDTFHKADDYVASIKKLASIIQRVDVKKVFADGQDVCVLYDMVTNTPAGTAFIVEWYQIRGDKIGSLRVVFDARPFAAMFGR